MVHILCWSGKTFFGPEEAGHVHWDAGVPLLVIAGNPDNLS